MDASHLSNWHPVNCRGRLAPLYSESQVRAVTRLPAEELHSFAMRANISRPSVFLLALAGAFAGIVSPVSADDLKVLGAYVFVRHGDRTAKVLSDTQLTDLGYREAFLAGSYYHDRYISPSSSQQIAGISDTVFKPKQVTASAPSDAVLQNSGTGFMQGVYPPVGSMSGQRLSNGSTLEVPLNGYQLIPLSSVSSGAGSEDSTWLQGSNDCPKSKTSSKRFYDSSIYASLSNSTNEFYHSLSPMLDRTFNDSGMNFKNAYAIFDYLNVASIHNSSNEFPSSELLTPDVYHQLLTLANAHEYNLAYNQSEPIRAVAGSVLAGQVLSALNATIASQAKSKLNIQFGAYATFLSYFGLAQLPSVHEDFTGIPDYASSMTWELVTNSDSDSFPPASEISVRFLFHNGTILGSSTPTEYPLFGQSRTVLPWSDFVTSMEKIAITSKSQWCEACGSSEGVCASSSTSDGSKGSNSNRMTLPVAGVIGAMLTLAVIFALGALFFLISGLRVSRKTNGSEVRVTDVRENKAFG